VCHYTEFSCASFHYAVFSDTGFLCAVCRYAKFFMLRTIILCLVIMCFVVLSAVILGVLLFRVIILRLVTTSVAVPRFIMWSVLVLSVIMLCDNECYCADFHYGDCH
jgi:hypothetical protein